MLLIEATIRGRALVQAEQVFVRTVRTFGQVLARRNDQPSHGEG